jgi:hypothetical protein
MAALKKVGLAAAIAVATVGIATGAGAQYVDPDYGGYASRYYATSPGYYDDDVVIVRRAPAPAGYGYWTPSRDTACIQARRDFAERTNFICQ